MGASLCGLAGRQEEQAQQTTAPVLDGPGSRGEQSIRGADASRQFLNETSTEPTAGQALRMALDAAASVPEPIPTATGPQSLADFATQSAAAPSEQYLMARPSEDTSTSQSERQSAWVPGQQQSSGAFNINSLIQSLRNTSTPSISHRDSATQGLSVSIRSLQVTVPGQGPGGSRVGSRETPDPAMPAWEGLTALYRSPSGSAQAPGVHSLLPSVDLQLQARTTTTRLSSEVQQAVSLQLGSAISGRLGPPLSGPLGTPLASSLMPTMQTEAASSQRLLRLPDTVTVALASGEPTTAQPTTAVVGAYPRQMKRTSSLSSLMSSIGLADSALGEQAAGEQARGSSDAAATARALSAASRLVSGVFPGVTLVSVLGSGAHGTVYKALHQGTVVALKVVTHDAGSSEGEGTRSTTLQHAAALLLDSHAAPAYLPMAVLQAGNERLARLRFFGSGLTTGMSLAPNLHLTGSAILPPVGMGPHTGQTNGNNAMFTEPNALQPSEPNTAAAEQRRLMEGLVGLTLQHPNLVKAWKVVVQHVGRLDGPYLVLSRTVDGEGTSAQAGSGVQSVTLKETWLGHSSADTAGAGDEGRLSSAARALVQRMSATHQDTQRSSPSPHGLAGVVHRASLGLGASTERTSALLSAPIQEEATGDMSDARVHTVLLPTVHLDPASMRRAAGTRERQTVGEGGQGVGEQGGAGAEGSGRKSQEGEGGEWQTQEVVPALMLPGQRKGRSMRRGVSAETISRLHHTALLRRCAESATPVRSELTLPAQAEVCPSKPPLSRSVSTPLLKKSVSFANGGNESVSDDNNNFLPTELLRSLSSTSDVLPMMGNEEPGRDESCTTHTAVSCGSGSSGRAPKHPNTPQPVPTPQPTPAAQTAPARITVNDTAVLFRSALAQLEGLTHLMNDPQSSSSLVSSSAHIWDMASHVSRGGMSKTSQAMGSKDGSQDIHTRTHTSIHTSDSHTRVTTRTASSSSHIAPNLSSEGGPGVRLRQRASGRQVPAAPAPHTTAPPSLPRPPSVPPSLDTQEAAAVGVSAHAHLPFGESHALIDVAMGRFTNAASSKESKSLDVAYGMSGAGKIRYRTFIVQEYCEHGNLQSALRGSIFHRTHGSDLTVDLDALLCILVQVARGMAYLHSRGLLHGDLKSQNIMLQRVSATAAMALGVPQPRSATMPGSGSVAAHSPAAHTASGSHNSGSAPGTGHSPEGSRSPRAVWVAKLSDFGLTRLLPPANDPSVTDTGNAFNAQLLVSRIGTVSHAPPETLQDNIMLAASDVYGFGMLMWEVFAQGEKPFSGLTPYQLMHAVVVDNTRPRFPAYCPDELVALGGQCMSANPLLRPSFEQVAERLEVLRAVLPARLTVPLTAARVERVHAQYQGGEGESQVGAHDEGSGVLRELMSSPPRRAPPQVPSAGPSVPARVVDLKQPQPTYL